MSQSQYADDGKILFQRSLANLTSIKVVTSEGQDKIKLNDSFAKNLQKFITSRQPDRGESFDDQDDSFFNLLLLLNERNEILR